MTDDEERELADALLDRAAEAGAAMPSRCAWCGRYRVGDEWLTVERPAAGARVSHGICPDCVEALRNTGQSI